MLYKKISDLTQEDMELIALREAEFFRVMDDVGVIINEVKKENDAALRKFTKKFDGADIIDIEVEDVEIENAYEEVKPELVEALQNAAANIASYHGSQVEPGLSLTEVEPGLILGYKVTPYLKCRNLCARRGGSLSFHCPDDHNSSKSCRGH